MNLFTRYLSRHIKNRELQQFIACWDAVEALVITVFKSKTVTPDDEQNYWELRTWLVAHYPQWQAELALLWRETQVGGERAPEDPFQRVFQPQVAADFRDDWVAMQNLAAAREALNKLILQYA
jgi:hypothetical protein